MDLEREASVVSVVVGVTHQLLIENITTREQLPNLPFFKPLQEALHAFFSKLTSQLQSKTQDSIATVTRVLQCFDKLLHDCHMTSHSHIFLMLCPPNFQDVCTKMLTPTVSLSYKITVQIRDCARIVCRWREQVDRRVQHQHNRTERTDERHHSISWRSTATRRLLEVTSTTTRNTRLPPAEVCMH